LAFYSALVDFIGSLGMTGMNASIYGLPFWQGHFIQFLQRLAYNLGVETTNIDKCMSSKDFVKWPCVSETAVPYLVDRLHGLLIVLALRPCTH